ncbi:MerR-type HTH domain containing protein [uncultured Caudovirales phage]|uniref:MerR-type HTH domain containing protein n=1 Tax=uncultured Caudovirales phage TaxID=2100421 RepID=A0A6J5M1E9_9CAUD|nr:MerR-type HTH domain containing protein [uncultured Caudovirales phage]CAB4163715.1 MerR-type HTH domain containing protein [uncultured Caudovirales phage]
MSNIQPGWTASELADLVNKQTHGCIRASERLVRFYTTRRLLDRPARTDKDARRAIYGERQLAQLKLAMALSHRGIPLDNVRAITGNGFAATAALNHIHSMIVGQDKQLAELCLDAIKKTQTKK